MSNIKHIHLSTNIREPILPTRQIQPTTQRNCCSPQAVCTLFCVSFLFWLGVNSQNDVSLAWTESEIDNWRTTKNHFTISNHNFLKTWYTPDTNIEQHFWYCENLLDEQPNCDWIKSQSFELPENKTSKAVKSGKKINFIIDNSKIWRENAPYWEDMKEACKYDLLLTFWTLGELNTPVYRLCEPVENNKLEPTKEQKGNKQQKRGETFRNFFSFNS